METDHGAFFVDPFSYFGIELTRNDVYERQTTEIIASLFSPGCTFVDLGANEAYFSIVVGRKCGSSGRVIAVEPQGRIRRAFEVNIELNDLEQTVTLVASAVGAEEGHCI